MAAPTGLQLARGVLAVIALSLVGFGPGARAVPAQASPGEAADADLGADDDHDHTAPPQAWVEIGPVLSDSAQIRVREANVRIVLDAPPWKHGEGYSRVSSWTIANGGPNREIPIRVAYRWEEHGTGEAPRGEGLLIEEKVQIQVAGEAGGPGCEALHDFEWVDRATGIARGWCEWRVRVPAGRSELQFVARSTYRYNWLGDFGQYRYDFAAERALRAPPERVVVSLALGAKWAHPTIPIAPPDGNVKDRSVTWTVGPQELSTLRLLAAWSTTPGGSPRIVGGGFTARASSTFPPQGRVRYDARQVLDFDLATVWCEGAPGEGKGEWVEVSTNLSAEAVANCRLDGFLVVGGHSRSRESWLRNGRIRRYQLSRCDAPAQKLEIAPPIPDAVRPDGLEQTVWFGAMPHARKVLQAADGCWRLSVLEVAPGKDPDACVSEFIPLVGCEQ